jgi:hypothetical protein
LKLYYQEIKLVVDWQGMLVLGIVIGSLISAICFFIGGILMTQFLFHFGGGL